MTFGWCGINIDLARRKLLQEKTERVRQPAEVASGRECSMFEESISVACEECLCVRDGSHRRAVDGDSQQYSLA